MNEEETKNIEAAGQTKPQIAKKNRLKVIALTTITLASLFALSAGTFAWFLTQTQNATIDAVAGGLGVIVNKVTAYKYVYPYFKNSTEYVDYGTPGKVKGYVVEDASLNATATSYSTTATFPLSKVEGSYLRGENETAAYNKIEYEESQDFLYYIVGDNTFNGTTSNPWSSLGATPFASKNALANYASDSVDATVVVENVIVSAGAIFTLFDRAEAKDSTKWHYTYGAPSESSPRFTLEKININDTTGVAIKCLRSGIYQFSHYADRLVIKFTPRQTEANDDTLIGGSILDPTQIKLDWDGREHTKTEYQTDGNPDVKKYLPVAIKGQNTMVILDVELQFDNVNPVQAGLQIYRKPEDSSRSITKNGGYNDGNHHITGGSGDLINASDFYCFYAVFTNEANKFDSIEGENSLWETLHKRTDEPVSNTTKDFAKFVNSMSEGAEYDRILPITPQSKGNVSLTIPKSPLTPETENMHLSGKYHFYVAVDYDYDRANYFLHENRLSKTFYLQRDFGFRFTATSLGGQS